MKYIAILRGINVGGHRKIKMQELRNVLAEAGFKNVQTYIQSGNVIFEDEKADTQKLGRQLEKLVLEKFGHEVPVIVWNAEEIKEAIDKNPFKNTENCHLVFLQEQPKNEDISLIENMNFEQESFQVMGNRVYLEIPGKYHESKLSNSFFEKKLKTKATTRNWKTVLKLKELSE